MVVVPIEAPVVTALTELGNGKPRFYSTPEIIAFCRKWRLPTNHVWLFSTSTIKGDVPAVVRSFFYGEGLFHLLHREHD
ncbi:hypothetical protein AAHE18_08G224100 [Arachis hypogaea]